MTAMELTIEELQAARTILVRIVQVRSDGAKFVPLVWRSRDIAPIDRE